MKLSTVVERVASTATMLARPWSAGASWFVACSLSMKLVQNISVQTSSRSYPNGDQLDGERLRECYRSAETAIDERSTAALVTRLRDALSLTLFAQLARAGSATTWHRRKAWPLPA